MSARAASRLETLGFAHVYRYQAGKADWFAAGLPREGADARTPRVADVARRDVPTCRLSQTVGDVRNRVREGAWDVCVVVDDQGIVLGLVPADALTADAGTPVEQVMQPAPVTFRPDIGAGQVPSYLETQRTPHALVTTSDGMLIGLLGREDQQASRRTDDAT